MMRLGPPAIGGAAAACMLAIREAQLVRLGIETEGREPLPPLVEAIAMQAAVLVPAAAFAAICIHFTSRVLRRKTSPRELDDDASDGRAIAAAAPSLAVFVALGWLIGSAHAARAALATGSAPWIVGTTTAFTSVLLLGALTALGLAALPPIVKRLREASSSSQRRYAIASTALSVTIAAAFVVGGVFIGDPSGARGVLGIFGVLRRSELDLRPALHGLVLLASTYVVTTLASRIHTRLSRGAARALSIAALLLPIVGTSLLVAAAVRLERTPVLVSAIRQHAPLGGPSLALLQRALDRDGDGYSLLFGGGDCDDRDAKINPGAIDIPGNGIDEDCSGLDTPLRADSDPTTRSARASTGSTRTYNVLLLTIDTLRFDLGFAGSPRPITPRLDALARRSTVFDNAYAVASMTWQSLGGLMLGKYPSELGGYERFNQFLPSNVVVTERIRDAGIRTFAGMCQFAFSKPRPMDVDRGAFVHVGHGFDIWDTSSDPNPDGYNYEDDAVTSAKLTDAAIALMKEAENVQPPGGRFFAWFHYFDPHTQYVKHPEAPDFANGDTSEVALDRARYESEVWFTDHHVGRLIDFVDAQPWGKDTAIIVTGDHGEAFNEHGMRWHRKELWEELIHVPLLVYIPDQPPRRVTVRRSHVDVTPTILELAGVRLPDDGSLRGQSLLDDILSPPGYVPTERDVYAEIVPSEGPVRRALITGPGRGMKLIHRGGKAYELYDLDRDPGEKKNLASRQAVFAPVLERFQRFRGGLKEVPWTPPRRP